ncbi:MAG: hypothetical protein WD942_06310, partial [Dehalococcoidia bacterium]
MTRYLVVAHQTATSELLLTRAEEIARDDPRAAFTILVPETHVSHGLVCDEAETREVAYRRAAEAGQAFEARGLRVQRTDVGNASPVLAIDDELRSTSEPYDVIVLSTLPSGISRWFHLDIPRRVMSQHSTPVIHVAEGEGAAWDASAGLRLDLARGRRAPAPVTVVTRPSRLEQPAWFLGVAVALMLVHATLYGLLAIRV